MKISKIIIPFLLLTSFVLMHNSLHKNAFDLGMSWTFSKAFPYILIFITAVLVSFQISRQLKNKGRVLSKTVGVVSFIIFCGVAFALNPIYEGDFNGSFEEVFISTEDINENIIEDGLTMIALPGCPFCYQRTGTLNLLKQRNKKLKIQVLFVSEDSMTIESYKANLLPEIEVNVSSKGKLLSETVGGSFPAFLYKDSEKFIRFWKQINFGTQALDWLEARN